MARKHCLSGLVLVLVLNLASQIQAQSASTGEIHGVVRDPSGAVVPSVTFKLKDLGAGQEKTVNSTPEGTFIFLNLQAGTYQLTASAQGFRTAVYDTVRVETGRITDIAVSLTVGAVTESIVVSGTQAELETTSNQVGTTVTNTFVQELPFYGRDTLNFALLQAGATNAGDPSGRNSTFNGLPNASMNISIDGINNNSQRFKSGGTSFFEFAPSRLDAVEEISVSSTGLGADASGQGAMQVQFTTKRGTNQYHFKLFEQFQNEDLNANSFFKNLRGQPISKTRAQNFGGNIGGPLAPLIPALKNKLFFFVNLEAVPIPGNSRLTATVPTQAAQSGLFTYNGTDGQQHTVNLLQVAGAASAAGTIDPTIASLFSTINAANAKATGVLPVVGQPYFQQVFWNQPTSNNTIYPTARVDYQITPKIAWRGSWNLRHQNIEGSMPNYPTLPAYSNAYKITTYVATLGFDYTITPHMLNSFTFGVQSNGEYFYQGSGPYNWQSQGNKVINFPTGTQIPTGSSPTFIVSSSTTAVPQQINPPINTATPFIRNNPVFQWADNLNWIQGRHKITIGVNALHTSFWETSYGTAGLPNYNLGIAAGDPIATVLQSGLPGINTTNGDLTNAELMYGVLTGRLASVTTSANVDENSDQYAPFAPLTQRFGFNTAGLYVQDSFRVSPQLTINYGLRWQLDGVIRNTNGIDLQPDGSSFLGPSTGFFKPGTLNGNLNPIFKITKNPYSPDYVNPAPNVGIAWNPSGSAGLLGKMLGDHKTVIRASYGISYYNEGLNAISNRLSGNPGSTQAGILQPGQPGFSTPGSLLLSSPLPALSVNPTAFIDNLPQSLFTFNSSSNYIDPHMVSPYVQNWTFGIQREIGWKTIVEARYVGNKATHVWREYNVQETNIFENGFLQQFIQAQTNLSINQANGKGNTFANNGLPGQAALPIFEAAFGGLGSQVALASSSGFGNSTFITNLQQGQAGALANSLATNNIYLCRLVGSAFSPCAPLGYTVPGKYPMNFFRPNPFVNNISYLTDDANTNYNALQAEVRKALSNGLTFTANYTWSHALGTLFNSNNQSSLTQLFTLRNGALNYGPSPFDVRHSFLTYWTYQMPFGRGRRFDLHNRELNETIGGWNLGGVWRFTTGNATQVLSGATQTSARNTVNQFGSGVVLLGGLTVNQLQHDLDTIGGANSVNLITNPAIIGSNGQANSQYLQPASTPGSFGQLLYLYGPPVISMDGSLTKEVRVKEHLTFNFQMEALNFLNHPTFAIGNPNPTASTFGQVLSTTNNPGNTTYGRVVQLRAYIQW